MAAGSSSSKVEVRPGTVAVNVVVVVLVDNVCFLVSPVTLVAMTKGVHVASRDHRFVCDKWSLLLSFVITPWNIICG